MGSNYFTEHRRKQLAGGPEVALRDEHYRHTDLLWPSLRWSARLGQAALYRSLHPIKLAVGHNMAIRSTAYDQVGGFAAVARDEDMLLSRDVAGEYGIHALGYNRNMKVAVSLRRIRANGGYWGAIRYYNADARKVDKRAQQASDQIR